MIKDTDKKILIQSDSKAFLKSLHEEINGVLYTADTRDEGVTIDMLKGSSVMLCSPVLSRGVSLKADIVFMYDSGRAIHPYVFYQMVDRARNSKEIYIALNNNKKKEIDLNKTILSGVKRISEDIKELFHVTILLNKLEKYRVNFITALITGTYLRK